MTGQQLELILTTFQDESVLKKQPYVVYRVNVEGGRCYYIMQPDGEPIFYISLTTLTKGTLPTSEHLIKWICSVGYDNSKKFMRGRANYGSIGHLACGDFLILKKWDFSKTVDFVKLAKLKIGETNIIPIGESVREFSDEEIADVLNDDMAAFAQWVKDYKVKPIAIELVLVSKDGYATLIDIVCKMTIEEKGFYGETYVNGGKNNPKGSPKESTRDREITGLANFKFGRKGFYDEHEIQVEFEKRLFEENYPDIKIDRIYNWSPKAWTGSVPTYNFIDQSESLNKEKADALLCIAKLELMKRLSDKTDYAQPVEVGEAPQLTKMTMAEWVKQRHVIFDVPQEGEPA